MLEKPFGTNAESAASLNELLADLVPEDQIHRVDHFLGRSTVLNLLGVRFANRLFEPLWNRDHIEHVDIVFDEPLALENRARYYDAAGALMDMIQSHLLQILALIAMDPSATVHAADLRDAKADALRACRVWDDDPVAAGNGPDTPRARSRAGRSRTTPMNPAWIRRRNTETLAELTVEIDNWRWAGVPFRLRSGKALSDRRKEVLVTFKPCPTCRPGSRRSTPDRLRLSMGPDRDGAGDERQRPGRSARHRAGGPHADLNPGRLPPYGEVLAGVLDGDPCCPSAATPPSSAGGSWIRCCRRGGSTAAPMDEYAAGSTGPTPGEHGAISEAFRAHTHGRNASVEHDRF